LLIALLTYGAAACLAIGAIAGFRSPGRRPAQALQIAEGGALAALAVSACATMLVAVSGPGQTTLLGAEGLGFAARLDAVSAVMLVLVSFIGWVVVRYSRTYLDGEAHHGLFMGWLCATLAAVLLLVMSANLLQLIVAWVATNAGLHRLLLFYKDRPAAQRAAAKRMTFARLSETALIGAGALVWIAYGTGDIGSIATAAGASDATSSITVIAAAACLAFAALLMSAQFPTHGWLTDVMEAPTPVSALLHAGVINAGGFLLIRFADVMLLAPGVLAVLVMLGGFTAIFASLVMLTQPAVKTSLAWSTAGQMGFMIMQCGLGLFALALLHIVAHSLYKAHAFLASGSAIQRIAQNRKPGPVAIPGVGAVGRAFGAALLIYAIIAIGFAALFGLDQKSPQALALGAILIFGVAYLLAQGLADAAPRALTAKTSVYALATSLGYFTLHTIAEAVMAGTLPAAPSPGPLEWALIVLALATFGTVAVAQAMFPLWSGHPAAASLRVHIANGFYIDALVDRALGRWSSESRP
jgi:NAD(P)H-quinone oxidoreductase subunit 5